MTAKDAATRFTSIGNELNLPFWTNIPWEKYVAWPRVLFAAAILALSYFYLPEIHPLILGLMVLFLAYSIVPAVRGRAMTGLLGLLALFGDTIYFLIVASIPTDRLLWVVAFLYLHLLAEALFFFTALETCVVAGACAVFCVV